MNKKEFIIEAALRLISANAPLRKIPEMARQLADEIYPEAPIHHGKSDTDGIEVLLKEVGRLEQEQLNERRERYKATGWTFQRSGFATRLHKVFKNEDINTVGDLTTRGRRELMKMRKVGKTSVELIDQALSNLYNITTW